MFEDGVLLNQLVLQQIEATKQQTAAVAALTERMDNALDLMNKHIESDNSVHEKHSKVLADHDRLWVDLRARVATWALVFSGVGAILMLAAKEAVAAVVNVFTGHP